MRQRGPVASDRPYWVVLALVAGLSGFCAPSRAGTAIEDAQLAALVRELDLLERLAQQSEAASVTATHSRYHFDYTRLQGDIATVRAGIEDYLSPPRAQPRDIDALQGHYRREDGAAR